MRQKQGECWKRGASCVVQEPTSKIAYQTSTFCRRRWRCGVRRCSLDWLQLAAHLPRSRHRRMACWQPARSPYTRCTAIYYVFSRPPWRSIRPRSLPPRPWSDRRRWPSFRLLPLSRRRRPGTLRRPRLRTLDLGRSVPARRNRPVQVVASYPVTLWSTAAIDIGRTCRRRHWRRLPRDWTRPPSDNRTELKLASCLIYARALLEYVIIM